MRARRSFCSFAVEFSGSKEEGEMRSWARHEPSLRVARLVCQEEESDQSLREEERAAGEEERQR